MASALERWRPRWGHERELARSPFGELNRMEREMHDMFDRFFREAAPIAAMEHGGPAIDLIDAKDEVVLRADLPGLEQKDLDLEVRDGTVRLHGKRAEARKAVEGECYCAERWEGEFTRTIALPSEVECDKAAATYKNGVLEVHFPKTKHAAEAAKKIEIRS